MRRRTILAGLVALVAALAVLAGVRLYPSSSPDVGFASPDGDLTCTVRTPDCLVGEVEVFKMWSTSNSHAGTVAGSSYPYKVCCSGPAGLSTDASGCYGTVLTLSDTDNAHAAEAGGYATEVALSVSGWETAVDCVYDASCDTGAGYACVATISGSDNAHVADCASAYPTKVCCRAQPDVNTDAVIGNGTGIGGDDTTVPNAVADEEGDTCESDGDTDNDGIPDGSDPDPGGDITYDDNGDGTMLNLDDDGPSWNSNGNAVIDGQEGNCPLAINPTGDDDSDGLLNTWEVCKWGTDPGAANSDGDALGDCVEAADVNGDGFVDFVVDVIYYAKAALLPPAVFGKDGDFDMNGDGFVDFVVDVIQEAKFGLIPGLCQ